MPEHVQFKLNLPTDVKVWLARQAAKNARSQGAEVVVYLRERMERQDALTS